MTDLAHALDLLAAAAARTQAANEKLVEAIRQRDAALRVARDAGATYVVMQEVAKITAPTVVKALGRSSE